MKHLSGKVVAITGAGSGIGRALALKLNQEGSLLALADVDAAELAATRAALKGAGRCEGFTLDVSNREHVYLFANDVIKALPGYVRGGKTLLAQPGDVPGGRTSEEAAVFSAELRGA